MADRFPIVMSEQDWDRWELYHARTGADLNATIRKLLKSFLADAVPDSIPRTADKWYQR